MTPGSSRRSVLIAGLTTGAAATGLARPATAAAGPMTAEPAGPTGSAAAADLALTHVTVIDATRRWPDRDMTVLISGDRIVAVGGHRDVRVPRGARVVDLTGKYLIPGLCDMHTHSYGTERISPPLFIANGVTSVREMAWSPVVDGWRDKINSGRLIGPRWSIASDIIDGSPSLLVKPGETGGAIVVADATEARRAVRRVKAEGADFVKVYSRLSEEAYLAIADEARRLRISFAGHCPDVVPIGQAAHAGQRSIEHLQALGCATSSRAAQIRRALAAIRIEPGEYGSWFRQIHPVEWTAAGSDSPARSAEVFAGLVRHRTWVTPTLAMHLIADRPEDVVTGDEDDRRHYVTAEAREQWTEVLRDVYKAGRTPEEIAQQRELFERRLRLVGAMQRAGVPLLAGSEAGFAYAYPGFSLHEELALLVKAGLTPLQALRAATLEPARFLGVQHELGSIRRGKLADLVVLDADPLADITNTTRIHAVLTGGRLISSARRRRMLADVARAVAGGPAGSMPAAAAGCGCHMPRR